MNTAIKPDTVRDNPVASHYEASYLDRILDLTVNEDYSNFDIKAAYYDTESCFMDNNQLNDLIYELIFRFPEQTLEIIESCWSCVNLEYLQTFDSEIDSADYIKLCERMEAINWWYAIVKNMSKWVWKENYEWSVWWDKGKIASWLTTKFRAGKSFEGIISELNIFIDELEEQKQSDSDQIWVKWIA